MNMKDFVTANRIKAMADRRESNPHMDDFDGMHWAVRLRKDGRQMTVPFSQGWAHTKPPTAEDVLDCLASDAASVENAQSFEDWCGDFGYDTDSRKAERTYKACERSAKRLLQFLGQEQYDELLWKTERL